LSDKFGRDPLRGVGGTRNCDWWFSDDAILLDTAGRYVLQDSNEAVDKKVWRGFLGLLKQFRPRQPINGALVAIGLPDLMQMTPEERSQHARAIKSRLVELQGEFGLRFPVYVLLTKMDRIAGFVEFFDDLDREERAAVWGMTFPLDDAPGSAPAIAGLSGEFDLLMERLNSRVLQRVNDERDFERRGRIFGFPLQVATLKTMLKDFMEEIFTPSRFEDRALLRGIYFTSATQEGTPIDRLMTAIASTFGLADQKPQAFRGPGKSYFVTRLLRDLIFEEASGATGCSAKRRWPEWAPLR
jgi:type VI secretion system protein ImpL